MPGPDSHQTSCTIGNFNEVTENATDCDNNLDE